MFNFGSYEETVFGKWWNRSDNPVSVKCFLKRQWKFKSDLLSFIKQVSEQIKLKTPKKDFKSFLSEPELFISILIRIVISELLDLS